MNALCCFRIASEAGSPYDNRGRFVPTECPRCGNGTLQYEGDGVWLCDGLVDPNRNDQPLQACTYTHFDGEAYTP